MCIPELSTSRWLEYVAGAALSNLCTVQASYTMARHAIERGIPGDFAECGVFAGAQSAAMARALMDTSEPGRRVHLFDSFEGIPQPGPKDIELQQHYQRIGIHFSDPAELRSTGVSTCNLQTVHLYMEQWGIDPALLVFHVGWFQNTLPVAQIERLAVLRLDGDLYESTRICLEHLYPKLSPGGWCIADDWELSGCRTAVEEYLSGIRAPVYWQKAS